ncbi:MAG: hypothetical protein H6572_10530 [Lewinellaceae bacterium]|nr:hypothetical protein [Lewinellaceae bacterium]
MDIELNSMRYMNFPRNVGFNFIQNSDLVKVIEYALITGRHFFKRRKEVILQ